MSYSLIRLYGTYDGVNPSNTRPDMHFTSGELETALSVAKEWHKGGWNPVMVGIESGFIQKVIYNWKVNRVPKKDRFIKLPDMEGVMPLAKAA